ncbi:MAG: hypothetical protein NT154_27470 [Verrucomicrobia bacterium]|nr:hypothetical protein [Verrucomicrobiota bacterium]
MKLFAAGLCACAWAMMWAHVAIAEPQQFILFNLHWNSRSDDFTRISREFRPTPGASVRVGVAAIFSYLQQPRERTVEDLRQFLRHAQETDTPVAVQLDGENWWGARPDLWNWWDPAQPGYSTNNRTNVEWTSWSPQDAVKIAWRNWGQQIRVLPPPNLMSARYRAACHEEMRVLIPIVLEWWRGLPPEKKHLLVALKLGHESSIGVNAWYYPDGNRLLNRPPVEDPTTGLKADEVPARSVTQIGYAAVKTAGLRHEGRITEADLAEIARRHLEDLCRVAAKLGVPRDKLFTHGAGWKENELLYQAALNEWSCPGWSFYGHADDPGKDAGVQNALQRSDAPWWAAVEWLFQGPRELGAWKSALEKTLQPRCRYLCIYNWNGVQDRPEVLQAVHDVAGKTRAQ